MTSYILLFKIKDDAKIRVGKLGRVTFRKGLYIYVGSAMKNLEKRILRHINSSLGKTEKKFWHIDYILPYSEIISIFVKKSNEKEECKVAGELLKISTPVKNIGCSDCRCISHLFYLKTIDNFLKLAKRLGFSEIKIKNNEKEKAIKFQQQA